MLGIVCGIKTEKKVALDITPYVACSGAREEIAHTKALEFAALPGMKALASFGVGGALSPKLDTNVIYIGTEVRDVHGQRWMCDEKLVALLLSAIPNSKPATIFGSAVLVGTPQEKKVLFEASGCDIVDMESHAVAKAGLPFVVIRGLSDGVEDIFPRAALNAIKENGDVSITRVLRDLNKDRRHMFRELQELGTLGKNTGIALGRIKLAVPAIREKLIEAGIIPPQHLPQSRLSWLSPRHRYG